MATHHGASPLTFKSVPDVTKRELIKLKEEHWLANERWYLAGGTALALGKISVIDARNIAVMKILAVSQRCTKRDFFDLYWYTKNKEKLDDLLGRVSIVFPNKNHNIHHILKSLIYFEEAESNTDPIIHFDASWQEVKSYFKTIVPPLAKTILDLE